MGAHSSFFLQFLNNATDHFQNFENIILRKKSRKNCQFFPIWPKWIWSLQIFKNCQNLKMGVVSKSDLNFGKNFVFNPFSPFVIFWITQPIIFKIYQNLKNIIFANNHEKNYQFFLSFLFCVFNFKISLNRKFYFGVEISHYFVGFFFGGPILLEVVDWKKLP